MMMAFVNERDTANNFRRPGLRAKVLASIENPVAPAPFIFQSKQQRKEEQQNHRRQVAERLTRRPLNLLFSMLEMPESERFVQQHLHIILIQYINL
jgi:hypothetical protein